MHPIASSKVSSVNPHSRTPSLPHSLTPSLPVWLAHQIMTRFVMEMRYRLLGFRLPPWAPVSSVLKWRSTHGQFASHMFPSMMYESVPRQTDGTVGDIAMIAVPFKVRVRTVLLSSVDQLVSAGTLLLRVDSDSLQCTCARKRWCSFLFNMHRLTHSPTHSLAHSLAHSLTHSHAHKLTLLVTPTHQGLIVFVSNVEMAETIFTDKVTYPTRGDSGFDSWVRAPVPRRCEQALSHPCECRVHTSLAPALPSL
jgi:hypothetical protein